MNETEKRAQYFVNIRNSMNGSVNAMLKMELTEIDETKKSVTFHFPLEQWEMNPSGHTHGGIICTMLDMSMGAAAYSYSDASFAPTIQMAVNFDRGSEAGDALTVESICDHVGSRMAQVRALARNKKGIVVASANGSYAINHKVHE